MPTKRPVSRFLAGALASLVATSAMAADLPSSGLIESGKLTYGVAATFAPFEFSRDGELTGFDIDMMAALAEKLGAEPVAKNMEFKGLIPALQGDRIDFINSAMYINPARSEQVDFLEYMQIGNRVVVQAGNPKGITGRDDSLCGMTIAVTLGGIQESQARADDERCTAAGNDGINVMTLPTAQDSALTLRQGRADAIYDSTPGAVMLLEKVADTYEVVGEEFEQNTRVGMAFRKGETEVKDAVAAALDEIVADGTYDALVAKWNLPASVSIFK